MLREEGTPVEAPGLKKTDDYLEVMQELGVSPLMCCAPSAAPFVQICGLVGESRHLKIGSAGVSAARAR